MRWKNVIPRVLCVVAVVLVIVLLVARNTTPGTSPVVIKPNSPSPNFIPPANPVDGLRVPLDALSEQISWNQTHLLAQLSDAVYQPAELARERAIALGFEDAIAIVRQNHVAWICRKGDLLAIVFRGTDMNEPADWQTDFDFRSINVKEGQMHRGFRQSYLLFKPEIDAAIGERMPKYIWLTGHSLGGALAVACAHDLEFERQIEVTGVVTFGQPRLIDDKLARAWTGSMRHRLLRIVNEKDPVARLSANHVFFGSIVWFRGGQILRTFPHGDVYSAAADENQTGRRMQYMEEVANEPTVMSDEELEAFQRQMLQQPDAIEQPDDSQPRTYSAPIPLVDDHMMWHYLYHIREHLPLSE